MLFTHIKLEKIKMSETLEGQLASLPATLLSLLGVPIPNNIPAPIDSVVQQFAGKPIDRIIINVMDNFGLFEITYYKPQFLISQSDTLLLLASQNPYTLGMFHQLFFGGFDHKNGFHLLNYLNSQGKETALVGRERDISRYDFGSASIPKTSDMQTWIEAAKVMNKKDLSILHYLDFEEMHQSGRRMGGKTPEELIEKLIKRTDKWFLSNFKQLRKNSLMIVLGNHGRYKIDLEYQGKVAEWRAASVPLAIFLYKE